MQIFDIHTHIGRWDVDTSFTEKDLLNVLGQNGVGYFGVSHLSAMGLNHATPDKKTFLSELEANEKLFKTFRSLPQALLFAVCEPVHGSPKNIKLLLGKYKGKFKGLKFHSEANQIPADSELYDPYMEIAKEFDLPCLFHSGDLTSPYSSPELIYRIAQRHPDVRVILGHLSNGDVNSKIRAIEIMWESVKNNNCKLYCDTSWNGPVVLINLIKNIPIDRIMFGSDSPMVNMKDPHSYNFMVNSYIHSIEEEFPDRAQELIQKIFYTNAKEFFNIK